MATKADICNLAIGHLGTGKEIANLDSDRTAEAIACRRYYELARDATLRGFQWPFATKLAVLQLVELNPTTEWAYSYQYPNDCLDFRRILSGVRVDTTDSRIKFKIYQNEGNKLILTDQITASCEYTLLITEASKYPADFALALSFRLASYIAPKVGGSEGRKLRVEMMELFNFELKKAKANALNEQGNDIQPDSEYIRARN